MCAICFVTPVTAYRLCRQTHCYVMLLHAPICHPCSATAISYQFLLPRLLQQTGTHVQERGFMCVVHFITLHHFSDVAALFSIPCTFAGNPQAC